MQGYSVFYQMCDAIEGAAVNETSSNTEGDAGQGVGLKKALPNYAKWFTAHYLPDCKWLVVSLYNTPLYPSAAK